MEMDCGPAENHTCTLEPLTTLVPALGLIRVHVPSGSVESVSRFSTIVNPAALSLASMPSLDVDAVHSGMATSSSVDVCDPFMANATPTTMAITAINATTTPIMMRLRFLALAAAARCSARDLTFAALVPLVGEICSNWPVTGLNACVGC